MVKSASALFAATVAAAMVAGAAANHLALGALTLAYNLECLEAEFYSWAAFGEGLNERQRNGGPASIGAGEGFVPSDVYSPTVLEIATEIAEDEIAHVIFLRTAVESLTGFRLSCPLINVSTDVFNTVATIAVQSALNDTSVVLDPVFDPYANDLFFLHGAFIFEDVGVTAYRGAVGPLLTYDDPAIREVIVSAGAGILGVEAYHAGIIRDRLSLSDEMPFGLPVPTVVQIISDLRDSVTEADQDQGILDDEGMLNLVPTDENGIAYARTEAEAVSILTLGGDSSPFFPEGFTPPPQAGVDFAVPENCEGGAPRFGECGGDVCCAGNNQCVEKNEFYSQCQPVPPPAGEVAWYGQCAGKDIEGELTCESFSTCVKKNDFYSSCVPDSEGSSEMMSSASIGLVAGLAGVAGVAVIALAAVVLKRKKTEEPVAMIDNSVADSGSLA